jgi:DnaK suppressor protein
MPTKEELEKFKKLLLEEKGRIEGELERYSKEFEYVPESPEEEADEAEEFFNYESVKSEEEKRLAKIDKALWKIEKGIFGICEQCGREIEKEVLGAAPESELCKECKAKVR